MDRGSVLLDPPCEEWADHLGELDRRLPPPALEVGSDELARDHSLLYLIVLRWAGACPERRDQARALVARDLAWLAGHPVYRQRRAELLPSMRAAWADAGPLGRATEAGALVQEAFGLPVLADEGAR